MGPRRTVLEEKYFYYYYSIFSVPCLNTQSNIRIKEGPEGICSKLEGDIFSIADTGTQKQARFLNILYFSLHGDASDQCSFMGIVGAVPPGSGGMILVYRPFSVLCTEDNSE